MHSVKPVLVTKRKGRSKSFRDDDVMLGQWPFVGHKFCSKLSDKLCYRKTVSNRYSTVRLKKKQPPAPEKHTHALESDNLSSNSSFAIC